MKVVDKHLFAFIFIILGVATIFVLRDEEKFNKFKKDFHKPEFIFFSLLILVLSVIGINSDHERIRESTRAALISFIIAYCAYVDLFFACFFITGVVVYITSDKNVTEYV